MAFREKCTHVYLQCKQEMTTGQKSREVHLLSDQGQEKALVVSAGVGGDSRGQSLLILRQVHVLDVLKVNLVTKKVQLHSKYFCHLKVYLLASD